MLDDDANPDKTSGYDPATVELDDGRIIDAAHHITNDRAQLLHLYIRERDGGIDVTIPLGDSDAAAWAKTDVGRAALGLDTDDEQDGDGRLVADGGRDVPACECGADLVRTAELTTALAPAETSRRPHPPMHEAPDAECTNCSRSVGAMYGTAAALAVWEARGESPPGDDDDDDRRVFRVGAGDPPVFDDDDDEDDDRLVADGGRDVRCTCGADLARAGEREVHEQPIGRHGKIIDAPGVKCGECGDSPTDMDVIFAVWEARGWTMQDADGPRLVMTGMNVRWAARTWRVAALNDDLSHVMLVDDDTDRRRVADTDDVAPVNGGEGSC